MKKGNIKDSFRHAADGIIATTKNERNMRIHWLILLAVLLAGVILKLSKMEWMICILLFALVLAGELFNTAIEAVVDLIMPEENHLAKKAKDAAAGAVLILAIGAAIIGIIIFAPKILSFII